MRPSSMESPEPSDPYFSEYQKARDLLRTPDWKGGLETLERLAREGSINSILLVADAMRVGWLYDKDLAGAETWNKVAVMSGSARGLFSLGLTYLAMAKYAEAETELRLAVDREYPPAYNALAGMRFRGDGGSVDLAGAKRLWRQGAAFGHLPSKLNLVKQQLRGKYGLIDRVHALFELPLIVNRIRRQKAADPYSDMLR